ncbi:MAG: hypothetical protein EPO16_03690 [Dehalococcoidia bacterium]|nr:MAG: hypothetical protein EPO16_03690 [Dehalococcoidia bacterium]
MELGFAFLCDAAQDSGGKLHALGIGVDVLRAASMPAVHARLSLVVRLTYGRADEGEHDFSIAVLDADGKEVVAPVGGQMTLRLGGDDMSGSANLVVDLQNTRFTTYGPHEVSVSLDGRPIVTLPLAVRRL